MKTIEREAVLDMAQFLMSYGFKPDEALKVAKKFWKKYKKKLKSVL